MSLYRRYRPKTFASLIGHETITTILQNAARENRLAHAYLFHGSRGTGKTTTARLIAKVANCQKRLTDLKFHKTAEPCNECPACRQIEEGLAFDITEIDAASNRGIDEIRHLQESVSLAPSSFPYKVFIIDEVHMLTTPAFNALLKTLEEPPLHAIFILATTEIEKVPATIISRTQKFSFKKLPRSVIRQKLELVARAENLKIDPSALDLISLLADGSLRDAESILDQVISLLGSDRLTLKDIENVLGRASHNRLEDFLASLISKNIDPALALIKNLKDEGYDIVQFNKDFLNYLALALSLKANPKVASILTDTLTEAEQKKLSELINQTDLDSLITLTKSLITAHREMRYSPFAFIPFEVAIIEFLKEKSLTN